MKIAFIIPRYGPELVGGAETLARQYAGSLIAGAGPAPLGPACGGDEPAAFHSALVTSSVTPGSLKFFIATQAADRGGACAVAMRRSSAIISEDSC